MSNVTEGKNMDYESYCIARDMLNAYEKAAAKYRKKHKTNGIVSKRGLPSLEALQIAAAHGRFLCNVEELKEEKTAPAIEAPAVVNGEISIIDYSEKAFAVIGDTKPIKDKLKDIGGSFNARLRCGPGWIFSKKRLEAVQKFLSNLSAAA